MSIKIPSGNAWEQFCKFFREEKGYEDWTDEQIDLSMNDDDIEQFIVWMADQLSKKKHLVVLRESFECDNNTPSDKVWAKITELDEKHLAQYEKRYVDEFNEDGPMDINVDFYPLSTMDEDWQKIAEIW